MSRKSEVIEEIIENSYDRLEIQSPIKTEIEIQIDEDEIIDSKNINKVDGGY